MSYVKRGEAMKTSPLCSYVDFTKIDVMFLAKKWKIRILFIEYLRFKRFQFIIALYAAFLAYEEN